jgi:hypothetical protein
MTTTTIDIPGMRLGAALNARVHWSKRAARAKKERAVVATVLRCHRRPTLEPTCPPTMCTLARIAPRALDDDNLQGAFKAVRDEVAAFFGVDDGPRGPIAWRYEQRREAPKQYAVEIRLTWGDA